MKSIIAGMMLLLATLSGCATQSGVVKDAANVIGKLEQNVNFESATAKNVDIRADQCVRLGYNCGSGAETRRDTLTILREANHIVAQKVLEMHKKKEEK